jgi:hypothetical protein
MNADQECASRRVASSFLALSGFASVLIAAPAGA